MPDRTRSAAIARGAGGKRTQARTRPHPEHPTDKSMRLYRVLKSIEEGTATADCRRRGWQASGEVEPSSAAAVMELGLELDEEEAPADGNEEPAAAGSGHGRRAKSAEKDAPERAAKQQEKLEKAQERLAKQQQKEAKDQEKKRKEQEKVQKEESRLQAAPLDKLKVVIDAKVLQVRKAAAASPPLAPLPALPPSLPPLPSSLSPPGLPCSFSCSWESFSPGLSCAVSCPHLPPSASVLLSRRPLLLLLLSSLRLAADPAASSLPSIAASAPSPSSAPLLHLLLPHALPPCPSSSASADLWPPPSPYSSACPSPHALRVPRPASPSASPPPSSRLGPLRIQTSPSPAPAASRSWPARGMCAQAAVQLSEARGANGVDKNLAQALAAAADNLVAVSAAVEEAILHPAATSEPALREQAVRAIRCADTELRFAADRLRARG